MNTKSREFLRKKSHQRTCNGEKNFGQVYTPAFSRQLNVCLVGSKKVVFCLNQIASLQQTYCPQS